MDGLPVQERAKQKGDRVNDEKDRCSVVKVYPHNQDQDFRVLSSAKTGAVTTTRRTNADMVVKIQTSLLPGMMVSSIKLALCVYNESKDYFAYIQPSDRNYDAINNKVLNGNQ